MWKACRDRARLKKCVCQYPFRATYLRRLHFVPGPVPSRLVCPAVQVPPLEVARELVENMNEYMDMLKHEEKVATKLKKNIDDIAAVVKNGADFDKEIAGASVVDMQMLLFNTRNMNKLKERYMNGYKNTNNEQQLVARRLRNSMNDQLQNPAIQERSLRSPSAQQRSTSALGISRPTSHADQSSILDNSLDSSAGGLSLVEELSFLRRRVKQLEGSL